MAILNYIEKHLTTYDVAEHSHNYWEIIYVTAGSGKIETSENISINYEAGEIICIPPHVYHTNRSNIGFKNIHLTLDNWTTSLKKTTLISSNSSMDLRIVLEQTHKYFHATPKNDSITNAFTDLIICFIEMLSNSPQISQATQILENEIINNYTDPQFNINDVYSKIPYSKEYTRKIFIKEKGISPLQFLINKRIECAVQLLSTRKDNNLNIREISEKCGFTDQLYFSRIFKKIVKISPRDYIPLTLQNNKIFANESGNAVQKTDSADHTD